MINRVNVDEDREKLEPFHSIGRKYQMRQLSRKFMGKEQSFQLMCWEYEEDVKKEASLPSTISKT